jgi:glycosyltransferase involved in cell wall biosynthesis
MTADAEPFLDLTLGVPLKNSAAYLQDLLSSLEVQKRLPAEVLFIDDGSTDHSLQIVKAFSARHAWWNIRTERNESSVGIGAIYNQIAAAARRTWVQILDADDFLLEDYYWKIAPYLDDDTTGIVTAVRSNRLLLNLLNAAAGPFVPKRLPRRLPVLGTLATRSGVIYRTAAVQHRPFIAPAFDGSDILHLIRLRADGPFAYVRKAKVFYRVHAGATTSRGKGLSPYRRQLRDHPDAGLLYRLDYVLRKKMFAWLRKLR